MAFRTERPPDAFPWVEIGRASPGADAPWIVWVAQFGESGTLYRTLVVKRPSAMVAIELQPHDETRMRLVHRSNCRLAPEADDCNGPVRALLGAADEAARVALTDPGGAGGTQAGSRVRTEAGKQPRSSRRRPGTAADPESRR